MGWPFKVETFCPSFFLHVGSEMCFSVSKIWDDLIWFDFFRWLFSGSGFPTEATFTSKWWSWTEGMMQAYGSIAAVPVSAMPIILHPLIFFAKLSKMSDFTILLAILIGRIIKYSIVDAIALLVFWILVSLMLYMYMYMPTYFMIFHFHLNSFDTLEADTLWLCPFGPFRNIIFALRHHGTDGAHSAPFAEILRSIAGSDPTSEENEGHLRWQHRQIYTKNV